MAFRYSQGFAEALVGGHGTVGDFSVADFALVSGGGSADTITRTMGDFTSTFKKGDKIRVMLATEAGDNVESEIVDVSALVITLESGVFAVGQAAGSPLALCASKGGSIPDIFNGGTLNIYSGTRPAFGSDDIGASSLLLSYPDVIFSEPAWDSTERKAYSEAVGLSAVVTASGQAVWFRLVAPGDNATGSSSTAKRLDGTVGVNTGDLQMKAVSLNVGETVSISSFKILTPTGA